MRKEQIETEQIEQQFPVSLIEAAITENGREQDANIGVHSFQHLKTHTRSWKIVRVCQINFQNQKGRRLTRQRQRKNKLGDDKTKVRRRVLYSRGLSGTIPIWAFHSNRLAVPENQDLRIWPTQQVAGRLPVMHKMGLRIGGSFPAPSNTDDGGKVLFKWGVDQR